MYDRQVIAIPVGMDDTRWLVIRRAAAGSTIQDPNDPFLLNQFDGMSNAIDHYPAMSVDMKARLMTAPDGRVLVIALKTPEPPPARRHPADH